MSNELSIEEIIANKTNIAPDQCLKNPYQDDVPSYTLLKYFKPSKLMQYYTHLLPIHYHKSLANDLKLGSSIFLNQFKDIYPLPDIPQARMDDQYDEDSVHSDPKLQQVFDEFPFFKFGGVSFQCTHDYLWCADPKENARAKDAFEIRYGIKLSDVYISLDELASVTSLNSLFSEIDDFLIVGNHDDTVLTILDNDLPYGARESSEKYECHFKPVFCIDQGVPVKYIKTVNDNGEMFRSKEYESNQRHQYAEQRKKTLKKLGEFYKTNNPNDYSVVGYPTDIDFVVKTGMHEFTLLGYDRFLQNGNFFITNVRYDRAGEDLKYTIKKCNFRQLPQQLDVIQKTRALHFNKMYGPRER